MKPSDIMFLRWKEAELRERNKFLAHLNKGGLIEDEARRAEELILLLQNRFGINWRPGNCRCIYLDTSEANDILRSSSYLSMFGEIRDQRYSHTHFFWASSLREKPFILDPTGVPIEFENHKSITPYFGLLESSTGVHRIVYEKMRDLDEWGTGEWPPGFHP